MLAVSGMPAYVVTARLVAAAGPLSLLVAWPGLYMLLGTTMCAVCALSARIVQPSLSAHRPIPVHSAGYARWWMVRCWPALQHVPIPCCE
jgi:hypothetical protein